MNKLAIRTSLLLLAAAAAPLGVGCTDQKTELCEAICNCENCGDKGHDRCDVSVQSELDIAETYGCLSQAEEYIDCVIAEGKCSNGSFETEALNCANEIKDLDDCKVDSSRRRPGPY
jgi:hypothetical protein